MEIDFDQLPENTPLKRLYRAAIRSHPAFAADITATYPLLQATITINEKEISPLALMLVLSAEEVLLQSELQQLRVTPVPPTPVPPPQHTGGLESLAGTHQKQVVIDNYVVMGKYRYDDLVAQISTAINQIGAWADTEVRYTGEQRRRLLNLVQNPISVFATNRVQMDQTITQLQNMLGGIDS